MSTRCNVVIKKKNDNGNDSYYQLYHHSDGYPDGVGVDLQYMVNGVMGLYDDKKNNILANPKTLAEYINNIDESYEIEGEELNLHGDIEYLYVMDLDKGIVRCYSVAMIYSKDTTDEDFVNGASDKMVTTYNGKKVKECEEVYCCRFNEPFNFD